MLLRISCLRPGAAPGIVALLFATLLAAGSSAQVTTTHLRLAYNFNGIVHPGEGGRPDDPNGFRSISDRALDFSGGVPNGPLFGEYDFVTTAGVADLVHLGNRNTVDGGNWAFDAVPDGDDVGIQPIWLPIVDQSIPQVTTLATPVPIDAPTVASFVYHISNGGGSFDVSLGFASGQSVTTQLSGNDWFGGAYLGTHLVDSALSGPNLSLTEAFLDLSPYIGEVLTRVTFSNRSNSNGGYAIYAAKLVSNASIASAQPIDLAYNFNGIVHAGESGRPDDPNGFRSVSDRALDFSSGVPSDPVVDDYRLVATPGVLDIVHLGNRNTVGGGGMAFDAFVDGDDIGIQPNWLANPDQTGVQTTVLAIPITLSTFSWAGFLYQISDGGGSFTIAFGFQSGRTHAVIATASDWTGGPLNSATAVDRGLPGKSMSVTELHVDLAAHAGELLTSISFSNATNSLGACVILAANVGGCLRCPSAGAVASLGGGNGPTMSSSVAALGCDFVLSVAGAPPASNGTLLIGLSSAAIPLSPVFPACAATLHIPTPIASVPAGIDANGRFMQIVRCSSDPVFCGVVIYSQYGQGAFGSPCPILLSDALAVTVGN